MAPPIKRLLDLRTVPPSLPLFIKTEHGLAPVVAYNRSSHGATGEPILVLTPSRQLTIEGKRRMPRVLYEREYALFSPKLKKIFDALSAEEYLDTTSITDLSNAKYGEHFCTLSEMANLMRRMLNRGLVQVKTHPTRRNRRVFRKKIPGE